jgi:hypothetical protein
MIRAGLIAIALWVSIPLLLLYVSLSWYGKRLFSPIELIRFAGIISFASIAHIDTNGGPRAWAIIGDSLSNSAMTQVPLKLQAQTELIPLPPRTIRKSCDRLIAGLPPGSTGQSPGPTIPKSCKAGAQFPAEYSSFITTANPGEMDQYVHQTLPAAGWVFEDRFGSAWFFRKQDTRLMMILTSYLTPFIDTFSLSLEPVPAKFRTNADLAD